MLNLDPNNTVHYNPDQEQAINTLINNRGNKKGKELWDDKGPNDIFVGIKKDIREHLLNTQKVRCAFCESLLEYGGVHIEHFAPKWKYPEFLYEPLNLVCSCPVCNGLSKKGIKNTIDDSLQIQSVYASNVFKYVHPYLDDVDAEIVYRDPLKIYLDMNRCSNRGKATIDLFHWNTVHARMKRFASRVLVFTTKKKRRVMIEEILNYRD